MNESIVEVAILPLFDAISEGPVPRSVRGAERHYINVTSIHSP
jgi:hypothetical protein